MLTFHRLVCALTLFLCTPAFGEEQRSFPTGGPGAVVTYLDAGGPGHPTGCVVTVSAGLPDVALSVSVYSNNMATLLIGSQAAFPVPKPGSDAGISVGPSYLFGKVEGYTAGRTIRTVNIKLINGPYGSPVDGAYLVVNRIVHGTNHVSAVADDAPIASGTVPQQPGVADALSACQQYMISRL